MLHSDILYFIWDTTTLKILDIIGYNETSYNMQSCRHDNLVLQNLDSYNNLLSQQALLFLKHEQPLLTEKSLKYLYKMAERWKYRLASDPNEPLDAIFNAFHTEFDTCRKEYVGIAIKLKYTPSFNKLPKDQWVKVFLYCQTYNIYTHSFWLLYFFFEFQDFWSLYSGRAKRLSDYFSINESITYLNTKANPKTIQHMMIQGSQRPLCNVHLQFTNGMEYSIALFSGKSLNVGRWSLKNPPAVALLLSPYMSTEVLSFDSKGRLTPTVSQFVDHLDQNTYIVSDGGLYKECIHTECKQIYDYDTTRCSQPNCTRSTGGQLRVRHQTDHRIKLDTLDDFDGVMCRVITRTTTTYSALNAIQINSNTVLYIQSGLPMILSQDTLRSHRQHRPVFLKPNAAHPIPSDTETIQFNDGILTITY